MEYEETQSFCRGLEIHLSSSFPLWFDKIQSSLRSIVGWYSKAAFAREVVGVFDDFNHSRSRGAFSHCEATF